MRVRKKVQMGFTENELISSTQPEFWIDRGVTRFGWHAHRTFQNMVDVTRAFPSWGLQVSQTHVIRVQQTSPTSARLYDRDVGITGLFAMASL